MSSYRMRRNTSRRYVRLILEELECRYVPSPLGVQVELPLPALLSPVPVSAGMGTASTPAPARTSLLAITIISTPASTSPGTTTTSPELEIVSVSFTPTAASSSPSSTPTAGSTAGVSQPAAPAPSGGGTSIFSVGSPSAFSEGTGQAPGGAFTVPGSAPTASIPGLGIQAALPGSSTALGETFTGVNFELLGNLPTLLGPANAQSGTANTASATSSAGASWSGATLNLLTDRTTGEATARGLTHPAPGDREEILPEQFLIPPDEDWFEPVPQRIEQTLPAGNVFLRTQANFPADFREIAPQQPDAVDAQARDALPAELPDGILFDEENTEIPADEDQPEEPSGMTAAIAILAGAAGVYWTVPRRSRRKTAVGLPEIDEEM